MAKGLPSGRITTSDLSRLAHEIYVPIFDNGALHYTVSEIIVGIHTVGGWELKTRETLIHPFPNLIGHSRSVKDLAADSYHDNGSVLTGGD